MDGVELEDLAQILHQVEVAGGHEGQHLSLVRLTEYWRTRRKREREGGGGGGRGGERGCVVER